MVKPHPKNIFLNTSRRGAGSQCNPLAQWSQVGLF
jgi:hypothetical protein